MGSPARGDMVRVAIGDIYHYGIYVSDDEIIQFGLPPRNKRMLLASDVKVISSNVDTFLCGSFMEVGKLSVFEKIRARSAAETVAYARGKIGTGGYNLLYNNCEHFANECVFGEKKCSQVDDVRAKMRMIPKTDIYVCSKPFDAPCDGFPETVKEEINACSDTLLKEQISRAWKIMFSAMKKSFGADIGKTDPHKTKNDGWALSDHCFSLGYNNNYVVAAVSNYPIEIRLGYVFGEGAKVASRQKCASFMIDGDTVISVSSENTDNISFYTVSSPEPFRAENIKLKGE